MTTITLWQPWASFIAYGWKTIETRTHDRFKNLSGEQIGIHAGKVWDKDWDELTDSYLNYDQRMITKELKKHFDSRSSYSVRGAIICTAFVKRANWLLTSHSYDALINCNVNRFGLFLSDIQLIQPIPITGHQGAWNYDGEIIYL